MTQCSFKISSLNIQSLQAHFSDLKADTEICTSQVICLQETWCSIDSNSDNYCLGGKKCHLNSVRKGAGIATFYSSDFQFVGDFTALSFQITVISSQSTIVLNLYRSQDACSDRLIKVITSIIKNEDKCVIIAGDWNICHRDETNHRIFNFLREEGFTQIFNPPRPTHSEGRCIDMIWSRNLNLSEISMDVKFKYYSDHGVLYLSQT